MKFILLIGCCIATTSLYAQELFTFTEPASNMPAKSIAIRANNYFVKSSNRNKYSYNGAAEIMIGISKKLMVHAEAFAGNDENNFKLDGASIYFKYRFFSVDEVHSHFRMAVYAREAFSNSKINQLSYDGHGSSSGTELGLVTTKLMNKMALSAGASFINIANNMGGNKFVYGASQRNAVGYTLSFGQLFLPVEYKNYEQTNVTAMIEFLGQTNTGNGNSFLDAAPSVQFIIKSKIRVDAGYRFPVFDNLSRVNDSRFLLRFEYNFFSVFK